MTKVAQQVSHDKYELADWLRTRFYFIKQQGGQTTYYDAETGVRTLTKMHLVEHLISEGMHSDDPLSIGLEIISKINS